MFKQSIYESGILHWECCLLKNFDISFYFLKVIKVNYGGISDVPKVCSFRPMGVGGGGGCLSNKSSIATLNYTVSKTMQYNTIQYKIINIVEDTNSIT